MPPSQGLKLPSIGNQRQPSLLAPSIGNQQRQPSLLARSPSEHRASFIPLGGSVLYQSSPDVSELPSPPAQRRRSSSLRRRRSTATPSRSKVLKIPSQNDLPEPPPEPPEPASPGPLSFGDRSRYSYKRARASRIDENPVHHCSGLVDILPECLTDITTHQLSDPVEGIANWLYQSVDSNINREIAKQMRLDTIAANQAMQEEREHRARELNNVRRRVDQIKDIFHSESDQNLAEKKKCPSMNDMMAAFYTRRKALWGREVDEMLSKGNVQRPTIKIIPNPYQRTSRKPTRGRQDLENEPKRFDEVHVKTDMHGRISKVVVKRLPFPSLDEKVMAKDDQNKAKTEDNRKETVTVHGREEESDDDSDSEGMSDDHKMERKMTDGRKKRSIDIETDEYIRRLSQNGPPVSVAEILEIAETANVVEQDVGEEKHKEKNLIDMILDRVDHYEHENKKKKNIKKQGTPKSGTHKTPTGGSHETESHETESHETEEPRPRLDTPELDIVLYQDEDGNFVDWLGQRVDKYGRLLFINKDGCFIDEKGQRVDQTGNPLYKDKHGHIVDAIGRRVDELGVPLQEDEEGNLVNRNGILVDKKGRALFELTDRTRHDVRGRSLFRNKEGNLVNQDGQRVDDRGFLLHKDNEGCIVNAAGRRVDNNGKALQQDKDGNYIDSNGQRVDRKGRPLLAISNTDLIKEAGKQLYRNKEGRLVDELGQMVDKRGNPLFKSKDGHLTNEKGEMVDQDGDLLVLNDQGALVNKHGHRVDKKGRPVTKFEEVPEHKRSMYYRGVSIMPEPDAREPSASMRWDPSVPMSRRDLSRVPIATKAEREPSILYFGKRQTKADQSFFRSLNKDENKDLVKDTDDNFFNKDENRDIVKDTDDNFFNKDENRGIFEYTGDNLFNIHENIDLVKDIDDKVNILEKLSLETGEDEEGEKKKSVAENFVHKTIVDQVKERLHEVESTEAKHKTESLQSVIGMDKFVKEMHAYVQISEDGHFEIKNQKSDAKIVETDEKKELYKIQKIFPDEDVTNQHKKASTKPRRNSRKDSINAKEAKFQEEDINALLTQKKPQGRKRHTRVYINSRGEQVEYPRSKKSSGSSRGGSAPGSAPGSVAESVAESVTESVATTGVNTPMTDDTSTLIDENTDEKQDALENLPEIAVHPLKSHSQILISEKGTMMYFDREGNIIDEDGNIIHDKAMNLSFDAEGNLVDSDGKTVEPLLKRLYNIVDGNVVNEQGKTVAKFESTDKQSLTGLQKRLSVKQQERRKSVDIHNIDQRNESLLLHSYVVTRKPIKIEDEVIAGIPREYLSTGRRGPRLSVWNKLKKLKFMLAAFKTVNENVQRKRDAREAGYMDSDGPAWLVARGGKRKDILEPMDIYKEDFSCAAVYSHDIYTVCGPDIEAFDYEYAGVDPPMTLADFDFTDPLKFQECANATKASITKDASGVITKDASGVIRKDAI